MLFGWFLFVHGLLSAFESSPLDDNARKKSFLKGCLCKTPANFVMQDRNSFPWATAGRLENVFQELVI